ncbi:MAG: Response regulator containing a CheY-like receiver domain and an DNA-binding domain [Actinomycetia bacterium]|nr:Response regulator containing a CheY-like receiver domain and an DNA-binding domain [Actinomycetes bacterium]
MIPRRLTVADAQGLYRLVGRASQIPCLLVDAANGTITELSASAARMLGASRADLRGTKVTTVARGPWRSEVMRLLRAGAIDGYSAHASVRRADGRLVPVSIWVRGIDAEDHRWVVLALSPDGDTTASVVHSGEVGPTVMGFGDGSGNISMVSNDVTALLGHDPAELVGYPSASFVHVDDLPDYLLTTSTAVATGRSQYLRLRLRHANGSWLPVRAIVTSFPNPGAYRIGFTFTADVAAADTERVERMSELEDRLRRIAFDLAAVGVSEGVDPEVARALGELTHRQQDIVRRLQEGARVPTIAQELYLSQSTVRNHLSTIFRKFGVASQEELLVALRA